MAPYRLIIAIDIGIAIEIGLKAVAYLIKLSNADEIFEIVSRYAILRHTIRETRGDYALLPAALRMIVTRRCAVPHLTDGWTARYARREKE